MTAEEQKRKHAEYARNYRRTHPDYDKHHVERQRRYMERVRLGLVGTKPIHKRNKPYIYIKQPSFKTKSAPRDIQSIKRGVLAHYGNGKCACVKCGQTDIDSLSLDHINNDAHHRSSKHHVGGNNLYKKLMNKNYPDGYQTLCMSCNFSKSIKHIRINGRTKPQNIVEHLPLFDFDFTQEIIIDIRCYHKVRLMPPDDSQATTTQDDSYGRQDYDVERLTPRQPVLS